MGAQFDVLVQIITYGHLPQLDLVHQEFLIGEIVNGDIVFPLERLVEDTVNSVEATQFLIGKQNEMYDL